jgi:hypothetical protein
LFNIKETAGKNIDLKITAIIDNAENVKLYYRNNFDKEFKQIGFEKKYNDRYYVAMIQAFDTNADYIEYGSDNASARSFASLVRVGIMILIPCNVL